MVDLLELHHETEISKKKNPHQKSKEINKKEINIILVMMNSFEKLILVK